jgi:hypothetical protein
MSELRKRHQDRLQVMKAALIAAESRPDAASGHYHFVRVFHTIAAMSGRAVRLPPALFHGSRDEHLEPDGRASTFAFAEPARHM